MVAEALADPRLADCANDRVLERHVIGGRIREADEGFVQVGFDLHELALERLFADAELAHPRYLRAHVTAVALGHPDRIGGRVLLGAQRLELGQHGAPAPVELDDQLERLLQFRSAARQRRAYGVRLLADQSEV